MAGQTRTTVECAEYLTTAVDGDGDLALLDGHIANEVTVLRDRFKALSVFGPPGIEPRNVGSGVTIAFLRGALAERERLVQRESEGGAPAPVADGLVVPGGVIHLDDGFVDGDKLKFPCLSVLPMGLSHAIHSPRPGQFSGGLCDKSKRAPASLSASSRLPTVVEDGVEGAWLLSEPTEDYVLGTDVTSFLSRSSVLSLDGLCLLNGACVRAEWVKHDETVQYVQDRLGLLRRLLRPDILNACEGGGDDSSGSALDGVVTPRGTPAVDTREARILGIETDAHGEDIRVFPEAIKSKPIAKAKAIKAKPFRKAKKKGEEGALVKQQWKARDNRTRGRGRGNR